MKNLLNRSVLLLLVFILGFTSEVFPQGGIVPPSSGALSSSDLAINRNALYTGNHPVTVPLFQVTGTRLSQGVSITYNSLSTIESELGQGWRLNAGGLITRVVFGLPDDLATYGWNTTASASDSLYNSYSSGDFQRLKNLSLPYYDDLPDMYYFNVNGMSGRFIYDKDDDIVMLTGQEYEVSDNGDNTYTITDQNGTTYQFGFSSSARETIDATYKFYQGDVDLEGDSTRTKEYTSVWHLSRMISNDSQDTIYYDYSTYSGDTEETSDETYMKSETEITGSYEILDLEMELPSTCYTQEFLGYKTSISAEYTSISKLTKISTSISEAELNYTLNTLTSIELKETLSNYDRTLREFEFFYNSNDIMEKIYESNSNIYLPPYKFTFTQPFGTDLYTLIKYTEPSGEYTNYLWEHDTSSDTYRISQISTFIDNDTTVQKISYGDCNIPSYNLYYIENHLSSLSQPHTGTFKFFLYRRDFIDCIAGYFGNYTVNYDSVTVSYGANAEKGMKRYYYYNDQDPSSKYSYPYPPSAGNDWKRGTIYREKVFNSDSVKVSEKNIYYSTWTSSDQVNGVRVGYNYLPAGDNDDLEIEQFELVGKRLLVDSVQTTMFDISGSDSVSQTVSYVYNQDTFKPVKISTFLPSEEKELITRIIYSDEYSVSGMPGFLQTNDIIRPIEVVSYYKEKESQQTNVLFSNAKITSGVINEYNQYGNLTKKYILELPSGEPISGSNFRFSNLSTQGAESGTETSYSKSSYYSSNPETENTYSSSNLLTRTENAGVSTAYHYGYKDAYSTAQAINASDNEVFYESFETKDDNPDRIWALGKVGYNSTRACEQDFQKIGTIDLTNGEEYKVSFWTKDGASSTYTRVLIINSAETVWHNITHTPVEDGTWEYKEGTFTSSESATYDVIVIAGSGGTTPDVTKYNYIDEIRICPSDASMSSTLFTPLIGPKVGFNNSRIVSQMQYDDLGRLSLAKDKDGNITMRKSYNYGTSLSLSPSSINPGSSGGNNNISVTSNSVWNVSESENWISVNKTQGDSNDSFTITTTPNTGSTRNGTVTVESGDVTETISVSQEGSSYYLTVSNPFITLDEYETETFNISSNTSWTISVTHSGDEYLEVEDNNGNTITSGSGNRTIYLSVDEMYEGDLDPVEVRVSIGTIIRYVYVNGLPRSQ